MRICSHHYSIGLLYAVILTISCSQQHSDIRPNVILILADDQGWGDLSIHGNQDIATPHIDQLAADGATFEHFYVQPVCSPTRAEILTGRYHFRSGVRSTSAGGERIDLDEHLISESFQSAGYRTAAFGKWHSGSQHPYHPNSRGFDEYYGFTSGHWGHYFNPVLDHNGHMTRGKRYLPDDLTNHTIDFMSADPSTPFFVFLAYNTPHSPMQVPNRWYDKFANKELQGVPNDSMVMLHARAALAMVENIDYNVGRITEHLAETSIDQHTVVLYMTDNGPNGQRWNGGMKGRKGSTDEGGVRSPLFVKWPDKIRPGISIKKISAAIDLGPTLLDICDLPTNDISYDGRSLKPLLMQADKDIKWPNRLLMQHWRGRVSLRSQQYKLDQEGLLYDMTIDPGQLSPITDQLKISHDFGLAQEQWLNEITSAIGPPDHRPFTIGHVSSDIDYLPVRDAIFTGNIKRSNRWPNDSYLTNWSSTTDSITWKAKVLSQGTYELFVHYTCPVDEIGSTIEVSLGDQRTEFIIDAAHDPALVGQAQDRYPRGESLVKDFKKISIGTMTLSPQKTLLSLRSTNIANKIAMDINRITIQRVR